MARTTRFREQHVEILQLASELRKIGPEELAKDAVAARSLLSKLIGKLSLHLAVEDRSLYPELQKSADPNVANMAKRFENEMGGLADAVMAWGKRWPTPVAIQAQPARFVAETTEVVDALKNRILREHQELYPALDAM
ncbi:MAG TPA: hemerythrin domain-containing protein [Rhodanobacter sp.]